MKIIISHDIDHLYFSEHWRDLFVPKYLIRAKLEWLTGKISFKELLLRWKRFLGNRYHNIPEIMEYDARMKIPSTFFIGFNKGKGLVYCRKNAGKWLNYIKSGGFETGVHGNSGSKAFDIQKERCLFVAKGGSTEAGIRMHYLQMKDDTKQNMLSAGYTFDSSEYAMQAPYKLNGLWEFPVQIMDSYEIEAGSFMQKRNLTQAKENTELRIKQAMDLKLPYLVIIFHDCYFSNSYKTWKDWYTWLTEYLSSEGYPFVSFAEAMQELENKTTV